MGWCVALEPVAVGAWNWLTVANTAGLHTGNSFHSSGWEQPCSNKCRGMKPPPKQTGSNGCPRSTCGDTLFPRDQTLELIQAKFYLVPYQNCPSQGNWQDRSPRLQLPPNNALF